MEAHVQTTDTTTKGNAGEASAEDILARAMVASPDLVPMTMNTGEPEVAGPTLTAKKAGERRKQSKKKKKGKKKADTSSQA